MDPKPLTVGRTHAAVRGDLHQKVTDIAPEEVMVLTGRYRFAHDKPLWTHSLFYHVQIG